MKIINTSNKPRLLIVGSFPKREIFGGIQQSCKLILDSSFFSDFELILFDSSQISNPPPPFIVRFYLAGTRTFRFLFNLFKKRPQAALIFCSDGASALEKGLMVWICKVFRIKTFIFPRAGNLINQIENSFFFGKCINYLFSKANVFLAQGENWNIFAVKVLKFSPNRIKMLHNWTATEDLLGIGETRKYTEEKSITKFLFVGWLEKEKGLFELLESINAINQKNLSFTITFIGDGNGMKSAQKFVTENQLSDNVIFEGWVTHDSINHFYQAADVFVLPSWAEGMPNALIEALSCGLAAIVSNVGMIPNYLEDRTNALIINPKDSKHLGGAMEELIIDLKLRKKISKNGHLISKQYFSTNKGLEAMANTINKLL